MAGTIAGCDGPSDIASFARTQLEWCPQFVGEEKETRVTSAKRPDFRKKTRDPFSARDLLFRDLRNVILMALLFEGAGFLLLTVRNLQAHALADAMWHALFHSESCKLLHSRRRLLQFVSHRFGCFAAGKRLAIRRCRAG